MIAKPATTAEAAPKRPRVVVVGAGFAGLTLVRGLARADCDVTLIDRRNHHLFQPLLYQVATAALNPSDIAWPIRGVLRGQSNARVVLGRATGVDRTTREVIVGDLRLPYDYLVIATGARHAYFGRDDWAEHAPGLKKIEDATELRRRVLLAFERAELASDPIERARLLTFVVVGAGPTGVEMAGAIAELGRKALAADFRRIDPTATRVILLDGGPRVLATFPPILSDAARGMLERLGVEVRTGAVVADCDARGVTIGTERLDAGTIVWAAGVEASAAGKWLGAERDRAGRVKVDERLTLPGDDRVMVLGDTALAMARDGKPLAGTAAVAHQQGAWAARALAARLGGGRDPGPFRYRHLGSMATIGRRAAVCDLGWVRLWGWHAWILWSVVHVMALIGARNRVAVATSWLWSYVTFERGARLITGATDPAS
jgi:NADH dehydrogenase FAD-containing subunit